MLFDGAGARQVHERGELGRGLALGAGAAPTLDLRAIGCVTDGDEAAPATLFSSEDGALTVAATPGHLLDLPLCHLAI